MKNLSDEAKTMLVIAGIFVLLILSIVLFVVDGNKETKLIDKTGDFCAEGTLVFYEDDVNKYYFNCLRSMFVKVDGKEYEIKTALESKLTTIEELKSLGLEYLTEKK